MAYFFRVRSYWWVGSAMIGAAALTACLVARDPASVLPLTHGEAVANALILWSALATGAAAARRDSAPLPGRERQS
jgi:NhaP-type Na+/H+ or K+/H+ antiporter